MKKRIVIEVFPESGPKKLLFDFIEIEDFDTEAERDFAIKAFVTEVLNSHKIYVTFNEIEILEHSEQRIIVKVKEE